MAAPLAWFRRHQKGMLIVFGVLLMAVFGLPSVFFNLTPAGGTDPEMAMSVVKYNGGSFTRGEFRDYRYRHAQAVRFVQELKQAAIERVGVENYRQLAPMLSVIDTNASPEELDRQVMRRIILKKKADELGMRVGDDAVLDFLQAIGGDDLTIGNLEQFAFDLFRGNPDFNEINGQLKKEIAVQQMYTIVASGLPRSPNITDAWENFLKLNKRRAASVLEYPVDRFIDKVTGEPTLADLRKIFAEGEYDFPDPTNEKPGFKARQRVKAVVLTANNDDFLTNAEASIKPEEIKELYDQYVESKHPLVMEIVPDAPVQGDDSDPAPDFFNLEGDDTPTDSAEMQDNAGEDAGENSTEGATEESGTDEKQNDSSAENAEKSEEAAKTEGDESGTDANKSDEEESAAEKADDGKKENNDEGGDGDEKNADDDDGLSISGPHADLTKDDSAVQEEKKQEKTEQEETGSGKAEQSSDDSQQETESADTGTGETAVAGAGTDQESNSEMVGPVQESVGDQDLSGLTSPQDLQSLIDNLNPQNPQQERRVKPLDEEVSRLLKRELARLPAQREMNNALTEAAGDIGDYGSDLSAYEKTKEGRLDEREPKPDPIDLEAIARDYKLQLQQTDLVDFSKLRDTPLGQIGVTIQRMFYGRPIQDRMDLAEYLFGNYYQLDEWVPSTVVEYGTNNQHVLFFVEKADTRIRTFDEARDDVLAYWRHKRAVELAKESASKVATELNTSSTTLMDKYPADANDVGEFSYHASGRLYPELNNAVRTGPEFMKMAFSLDVGQAGVAVDATKDHVYVIQVSVIDTRTDEELRKTFFDELGSNGGMSPGVRGLYEVDTQEFITRYFQEIDKELDIKWLAH